MIQIDPYIHKLIECRWDIKQLQTRHNDYVDGILAELKASEKTIQSLGGLPKHVMKALWTETIELLLDKLVDGYSKIKKCTTEGRGQMSQDLSMLRKGLEGLTGLSPPPNWDYVNNYVIAFYLPEQDFLSWMKVHTGYSYAQYESIATLGVGAMMKTKQRRTFLDQVMAEYKQIEDAKARGIVPAKPPSAPAPKPPSDVKRSDKFQPRPPSGLPPGISRPAQEGKVDGPKSAGVGAADGGPSGPSGLSGVGGGGSGGSGGEEPRTVEDRSSPNEAEDGEDGQASQQKPHRPLDGGVPDDASAS
jgi:hypothetical protein